MIKSLKACYSSLKPVYQMYPPGRGVKTNRAQTVHTLTAQDSHVKPGVDVRQLILQKHRKCLYYDDETNSEAPVIHSSLPAPGFLLGRCFLTETRTHLR